MDDPIQQCFDESYQRLVGQMFGVCGDLGDAEEVVAEAFVRAVSHRRTFERLDNPEAWLRTVALNVARNRHRRKKVVDKVLGRQVELGSDASVRAVDLGEDRMALVQALQDLSRPYREALALHYLADLPVDEVARTLDVPVGTVKARLSRGRKALAAELGRDSQEVSNHA